VTPEQALQALASLAGTLPGWAGPVATEALKIAIAMANERGGESLASQIGAADTAWADAFTKRFPNG
jgi:hypothetical protein